MDINNRNRDKFTVFMKLNYEFADVYGEIYMNILKKLPASSAQISI